MTSPFRHRLAPVSVTLFLVASTVVAAEMTTEIPIPAAAAILAKLRPGHPRLLATADDFAQLKERVKDDATLKRWHAKLVARADHILREPPSKYAIPDGLRLLDTSRRVVDRVYTLALLYRLDGDRRYADRAWLELEAAANFKDWNPRHFLDTAEMTHGFAIGYDWLYDVWSDDQRVTLRRAMVEKGLRPGVESYRSHPSYGWWTTAKHNWNQVCNGGLGMGALALADVEPELAGEFLHAALGSLQLPMREFAPDGAWAEGPGYWDYATEYNVVFLAALQSALGTDFGLSDLPGFDHTGQFPLFLTGPTGRTFNYADGDDDPIRAPQMFWLARRFHLAGFARYELAAASPHPLDLLWFDPRSPGTNTASAQLNALFRGANVATLRSAWDDPNAVFVGFKGGDNQANHSHLDLGTFVLDALGVRWAVDLGADDYNLPGYFGGERWTYYRLRAEGHNTLVINPGAGPDQDPKAAAKIGRYDGKNADHAFAVADLSAAYAGSAQRVNRGVALLDRGQVLVQDELEAKQPAEVWWFFHTPAEITLSDDGTTAMLTQKGQRLVARLLAPAKARFTVMDAQSLPTSPHPEKQAANASIKKLAIHLGGVADLRLAVLLTPVKPGDNAPLKAPKLTPLRDW
ncbi:MAG: heparinase II/III family protein [Verrucomicrobiota bacterium]|jgi:hypothetical protein